MASAMMVPTSEGWYCTLCYRYFSTPEHQCTPVDEIRRVPSAPWYFASPDGRLFSTLAPCNQTGRRFGRIHEIARPIGSNGYITLRIVTARRIVSRTLHSMVAETFLGPKPEWAHELRHLDGDKINCRVSNLAWGTYKENAQDRIHHGHHPVGSAVRNSKLTEDAVREMRRLHAAGYMQKEIAAQYKVVPSIVSRVVNRVIWRHVQ